MKWITVQPLNGGIALGIEKIFGAPKQIINNSIPNNDCYVYYCNVIRQMNVEEIKCNSNLSDLDTSKIEKNVDLVCYIPFCSGLSLLNTKSCFLGDDTYEKNQNITLLTEFILKEIKPKIAVFENSSNLITNLGSKIREKLIKTALENGYSVTFESVNLIDFGVPQKRKRCLVYFWKDNFAYIPKFKKKKPMKIDEYLSLIPESASLKDVFPFGKYYVKEDDFWKFIEEKYSPKSMWEFLINHSNSSSYSVLKFILENDYEDARKWLEKRNSSKLEKLVHAKTKKENNKNYWDDSPFVYSKGKYFPTLSTRQDRRLFYAFKKGNQIDERNLSIREFLHLMGMPHDYEYPRIEKRWIFIFQSCPVQFSEHLGKNAKMFLGNELEKTNSKVLIISQNRKIIEIIK